MATSPTAKEVSVDLTGFKTSVDQQFKSLKDEVDKRLDLILKLIFAMFAIFPIIIGGGFLLRSDLGEVKVELAKIGVQVTALREDTVAPSVKVAGTGKGHIGVRYENDGLTHWFVIHHVTLT